MKKKLLLLPAIIIILCGFASSKDKSDYFAASGLTPREVESMTVHMEHAVTAGPLKGYYFVTDSVYGEDSFENPDLYEIQMDALWDAYLDAYTTADGDMLSRQEFIEACKIEKTNEWSWKRK